MNYTFETTFGTWRIEQDTQRNWVVLWLKRAGPSWRAINIYYTQAGAAAAVGCGETTETGWDSLPHEPEEFDLSRWQPEIDPKQRVTAA